MAIKKKPASKKMMLVCTEYRAVFIGYIETNKAPDYVDLTEVRNVLYWHQPGKGLLNLAKEGPSGQCKIGSKAPNIRAYKVTATAELTPEAQRKFEALP